MQDAVTGCYPRKLNESNYFPAGVADHGQNYWINIHEWYRVQDSEFLIRKNSYE